MRATSRRAAAITPPLNSSRKRRNYGGLTQRTLRLTLGVTRVRAASSPFRSADAAGAVGTWRHACRRREGRWFLRPRVATPPRGLRPDFVRRSELETMNYPRVASLKTADDFRGHLEAG